MFDTKDIRLNIIMNGILEWNLFWSIPVIIANNYNFLSYISNIEWYESYLEQ